jgi:hypothetical protein
MHLKGIMTSIWPFTGGNKPGRAKRANVQASYLILTKAQAYNFP